MPPKVDELKAYSAKKNWDLLLTGNAEKCAAELEIAAQPETGHLGGSSSGETTGDTVLAANKMEELTARMFDSFKEILQLQREDRQR